MIVTAPSPTSFRSIVAASLWSVLGTIWLPSAQAQTSKSIPVQIAEPIVVSATRTGTAAFDVPASIDGLDGDRIREGRPQINLSESLSAIPGIAVQNRQNYAQDLQVSVRGFGARSTFGVRGVRFYVDDIPATMPDGQGQLSHIDLGSVGRIEVLRGPFSALYGNSSGGVVQVFTEEPPDAPGVNAAPSFAIGSYRTRREGLKLFGASGPIGYVADASRFSTEGYRNHSAARRDLANAKVTIMIDEASTLSLVANRVSLPKAEDPLGLSHAQFDSDPRSVDPSALAFNTRKTLTQTQAGAVYERRLGTKNTLRVLVYGGDRSTEQYQAIPTASQIAPTSPGGVIDLARRYRGTDLRWTHKTRLGGQDFTLIGGVALDVLEEHRLGYQNFISAGTSSSPQLGVRGELRRDEDNRVNDFDQYAQISWQIGPRWSASAGLRHSKVEFRSADRFVTASNPDDSGRGSYSATLPVFGVLYSISSVAHWYAAASRGFETPTLNELAYSPNGATGLNLALRPARSNNYETGIKLRLPSGWRIDTALFGVDTRSEIVTLTNQGGRSTFTNAGKTKRRGFELAVEPSLAGHWRALATYTFLDAVYSSGFFTCTSAPCSTPTTLIGSGRRIPGVARNVVYGEMSWEPPQGWRFGVEAKAASRIAVNDLNFDAAPGYAAANVRVGYLTKLASLDVNAYARIDNVFDRRYAGSVIVNEGNGRNFEPAQGRAWLVGITGTGRF
jgi:iron complex outermembrane receptor protein